MIQGAVPSGDTELAERLLRTIRDLARELQPGRRVLAVGLDSRLDRELGLDSLSRVELMVRVERSLGVRLPEETFNTAETPRDLLRAIVMERSAGVPEAAQLTAAPLTLTPTGAAPAEIDTLVGLLEWRAGNAPDRIHALVYESGSETPRQLTYWELLQGARQRASGLLARGLEPGQSVAIMLPTGVGYLEVFFAVLLAGGVPVPIYPPTRPSQLEDHLRRHARLLDNAQAVCLVTVPEAGAVARLLKANVAGLRLVVAADELLTPAGPCPAPSLNGDTLGLLQYTSGSTGQPKGVMLSHAQLLANIRAMGEVAHAGPEDVFVSWLPLYHDMGLIGAWLGSLHYAMVAVLMPPVTFLARPWRWLRAIQQHRGTISAAPNFAYEMCVNKIPDDMLEGLDLGTWRLAFNGAEPVSARSMRGFAARFGPYRFDPGALAPVYGLAECGVGLAFPPPGRGLLVDHVQRDTLERSGRALPAEAGYQPALDVVACGRPLPGYEIRIVDPAGRELADRQVGSLQFRGPSATRGYFRNAAASERLFHDGWLDSGDLAYVSGGDAYLTGRSKDLIIRAGRNIHPYELEEAVGDVAGIRKGCVAVFGAISPGEQLEQLIVVAESRESEPANLDLLRSRIEELALDVLGVRPDDVLLVPPHSVLKTSSGKIRRAACRELYESRRLGRAPRTAAWQALRLWLSGVRPLWRRARRAAADLAYAVRVYAAFLLLAPVGLLAATLPGMSRRWHGVGWTARAILRLAGVPLQVHGGDNLGPRGPAILVANHASYTDGLVLLAALPAPAAFVAKAELQHHWLAGWFLSRIGCLFVERFDAARGQIDARRLADAARSGTALLVFPEGTFTRSPGLRPFHLGGFVAAAEAGLPTVPVIISGTRSLLRGDDRFPRASAVTVTITAPLEPDGSDWNAALALRNRARAVMLGHLDEPDLAADAANP